MSPEWLAFGYGVLAGVGGTALAAGKFVGSTQTRLSRLEDSYNHLPAIEERLALIQVYLESQNPDAIAVEKLTRPGSSASTWPRNGRSFNQHS